MTTLASAIVDSPISALLARIVLTTLFWMAGLYGVFNFSAIVQEMVNEKLPVPVAFAVATIATQILGSALVITNFQGLGWVGAVGLAVFTLLTIPFGHAFWTLDEPRKTAEFHIALEHITVAGGLLLAAIYLAKR